MASTTSISTSEASEIARRLRELITPDMISKAEKVKDLKLYAGPPEMDAGEWLEVIVDDRRLLTIEHLKYLEAVFDGLASAVERMATALTGTDGDSADALDELNSWIDDVNGLSITAVSSGAKDNYNSGDTGGDPQLLWEIGPTGTHKGDESQITISLPTGTDDLPNQKLFDDYKKILDEAQEGEKPPAVIFTDDGHVIKETDPE